MAQDLRAHVSAFGPNVIIDCVGGTDCVDICDKRRYVTIVGDKTSRCRIGGPFTYYD